MIYQEFPKDYFGQVKSEDEKILKQSLYPYKRFLVAFIDNLPENAVVLDAGCGSGKAIRIIKSLRPDIKIYASDFADVSEYLPKDVVFKKGSVEEMHTIFGSGMFDAIICQHVVEHLQYPIGMINSFSAALKKGGKLFLETPNWTRLFAPFSHFFFWNDYTHVRPYTTFAFRKLFAEHHFDEEKVVTVSSCTWFMKKSKGGKSSHSTGDANEFAFQHKSLLSKVLARLLNPLFKDVLIGIAVKK